MLRDVLIDLWSGRCAISRLGKGTTTHPHVANALNGLALRLLRAGGFVEAAPLYQHVLAIRKEGQVYRKSEYTVQVRRHCKFNALTVPYFCTVFYRTEGRKWLC